MFRLTFAGAAAPCMSCALLAAIAALCVTPAGLGQFCQEQQKLTASDGSAFDGLGTSVAVSGDTIVVGDCNLYDAGAAYIYVRSGPPDNEVWTEQAKLAASKPDVSDCFGGSVAVSGDTVVIGSIYDEPNHGAAYVFVRSGPPGSEVWTQQTKLVYPKPVPADTFGYSVALLGDTAVVGTGGTADVFTRSGPPGSEVWTHQAELIPSDPTSAGFGASIALWEDTAVVGSYGDDIQGADNAGSAYVFVRSGTPGNEVWTEQARLIASDAAANDEFGFSVALGSDVALVGAPVDDHAGEINAGSAYVFIRTGPPGNEAWTQQAKLTASDSAADDQFGKRVALSGDTALVGAWLWPSGLATGAAYVFRRAGTIWIQEIKLNASDAAQQDHFGWSLAMSGDTAVISSPDDDNAGGEGAGSAYIFECPTLPGCPGEAVVASDAAAGDEFGISVAIDGDTAVVGARLDDNATGVDAGAAYVYVRSGPPGSEVWTEQAKLIGEEPIFGLETGNQSGISVAVSGDTAIVGSWLWPIGNATGLIYIFGRSGPPDGEVWTQQVALACPQFGSFQYFGYAVALEGDTALVGCLAAPGLNVGGQAFFLTRSGPPGGESWTAQQKFPSDGVPGDQFGNSVAMSPSQDTAVVAAFLEDNAGGVDAGSAYVFVKSGNAWIEYAKLTASDGAADDRFGVKVAINGVGDTIVVGSYQDDNPGSNSGSAYVFVRTGPPGSEVWTQQAKLTASDAAAGDHFGVSLALGDAGDKVVIGAYADDNTNGSDAGSAYVFTRTGTVWTQQYKLTAPDGAADDWFGVAVAFDGETPMIGARQDDNTGGANAGSAYVFECLDIGPTVPACPADIAPASPNGDGNVNVDDLLALINAWGPCAGCSADIAPGGGDGAVNVDDLLMVINAWGPCD